MFFEVSRQSWYFFYKNFRFLVPLLVVVSLLYAAVSQPDLASLKHGDTMGKEQFMRLFVHPSIWLTSMVYMLEVPLLLCIVRRRIVYPQESVSANLFGALGECWGPMARLILLIILASIALTPLVLAMTFTLKAVPLVGLLLVPLGMYLMLRCSLVAPALVEDRLGPITALKASFAASRSRVLLIVGCYLSVLFLGMLLTMLLGIIGMAGGWLVVVLTAFVDIGLNALLLIMLYRIYLIHKTGEQT